MAEPLHVLIMLRRIHHPVTGKGNLAEKLFLTSWYPGFSSSRVKSGADRFIFMRKGITLSKTQAGKKNRLGAECDFWEFGKDWLWRKLLLDGKENPGKANTQPGFSMFGVTIIQNFAIMLNLP